MNKMHPCTCQHCTRLIQTKSADPWVVKIQNMVRTGRLEHVETSVEGKPVYRLVDDYPDDF
jgi:hypothetical protein